MGPEAQSTELVVNIYGERGTMAAGGTMGKEGCRGGLQVEQGDNGGEGVTTVSSDSGNGGGDNSQTMETIG